MAGIFQGDIIIKTAIELGIEDMRKQPFLIDHMLSDLKNISYFSQKYGQKQIDACKEWFRNQQIDVYMRGRDDKDRLPCVTIEMGPSPEKEEMKTMADQSTESVKLLPNEINKPIPYVVKPFVPTGYDEPSGELSIDDGIDLSGVTAGMVLVNPTTGEGYVIIDILPNGLQLESGLELDTSKVGILPQNQFYTARVEHAFFQETYNIGCHAHGDAQNLLWLWSIVKYSILRYRESLLEANGFAESVVSSGNPDFDGAFTTEGGEKAWQRGITITGQVENTWIKSPRRTIEAVVLKEKKGTGYIGGISIISNTDPDVIDKTLSTWYTDTEEEIEDSED